MDDPINVNILCCNIRRNVAVDIEEGNGWDARKELCAEVMRAHSPDVICLQECSDTHFDYLRGRLPGFDSYGLADLRAGFDPANAIFFARDRLEAITAGGFWLSETPHVAGSVSWDSKCVRFANWVHLRERSSGREFRVTNTHLDHIGQTAREKQAQLIIEAAAAFADDLPQLLTADFNADASNPAIDVIKAGGWLDTHAAVHGPADPGFTFHAFLGARFPESRPPEKIKGKIDFIFCKGPVRPLAADIIRDCRDGRYPSDHYFLSTEVEI
jgi:endonuclease/exonuclease/phosphatase family metal-dependent hydrolase